MASLIWHLIEFFAFPRAGVKCLRIPSFWSAPYWCSGCPICIFLPAAAIPSAFRDCTSNRGQASSIRNWLCIIQIGERFSNKIFSSFRLRTTYLLFAARTCSSARWVRVSWASNFSSLAAAYSNLWPWLAASRFPETTAIFIWFGRKKFL